MSRYSQPPPALQVAIDQAASRYGVPASDLAGIWAIESGRSYPNPYVNPQGYGGLFGTTDWNGPTQEQADLAAQIYAKLLKQYGGDKKKALQVYSHGGYSSVPGELTGNVARPGVGGSGSGSFWSGIEHGALDAAGLVFGPFAAVFAAAESAITGPVDFLKAAVWLVNPVTWLRFVEGVIGVALLIGGLLVAAGVGGSAPIPGAPPIPIE